MSRLALSHAEEQSWVDRLLKLGWAVRKRLRESTHLGIERLSQAVAQESGDTVFAIDRHVESTIEAEIDSWPDATKPLLLIAEGMGTNGRKPFGPQSPPLRFRLIVDPIDGTRGLMYDKRSAWFLAAIAPDCGEATTLADTFISVMVELPVSKQGWADSFASIAGREAQGFRQHLDTGERRPLSFRPSRAETLKEGFGQVSNFFPGAKVLASELMERIATATLGELRPGAADIFDDQYISSGGQMVELILGHDRFCCDLRPLFYDILSRQTGRPVRGLECHPYDLAGLLVAQQAGLVLTDGWGRPLNGPLDVETGLHWCAYANPVLQRGIQPVILDWLKQKGL